MPREFIEPSYVEDGYFRSEAGVRLVFGVVVAQQQEIPVEVDQRVELDVTLEGAE